MALTTREKFGLPPRLFLYTRDQIADMLAWPNVDKVLHFDGRSVGVCPADKMVARNVAPEGVVPEWRVEEAEFIRWMRHKKLVPMTRRRDR